MTARKAPPKKKAAAKNPGGKAQSAKGGLPRKKKATKKKTGRTTTKDGTPLPPAFVANQFKPGVSGNPAGRPKGRSLQEAFEKLLEGVVEMKEGENITKFDALVRAIFSEAVTRRNSKILTAIMDRMWEKSLKLVNDPDNPIGGGSRQAPALDFSQLTDAELRTMIKLKKKAAGGGA